MSAYAARVTASRMPTESPLLVFPEIFAAPAMVVCCGSRTNSAVESALNSGARPIRLG